MPVEPSVSRLSDGKGTARERARALARLARRQHGVAARTQARALGASDEAVNGWIERGRLVPIHRGVYAVGHGALTARGRWMAAVLACGPGAALCRRSAGALWGLRRYSGMHEVAAPTRRRRRSIRVCELALAADEITTEDGIPVTTVARTLLDLASVLDHHRLAQAVGTAEKRLLTDAPSLPELIERHRGVRGLAKLRAILADRRLGLDVPASELEVEFAAFVDEHGLPRPERNVWLRIDGRDYELDCLWREARLVVELDSRAHHENPGSFEGDRARDAAVLAAGLRTVRVTSRRLRTDGERLARELRAALRGRAGP